MIDIFESKINSQHVADIRERDAIYAAQEIIKTPFLQVHLDLITKVCQLAPEDATPRLLFKVISLWQKKQKIGVDYAIEIDEKKCETYTTLLVDKFV